MQMMHTHTHFTFTSFLKSTLFLVSDGKCHQFVVRYCAHTARCNVGGLNAPRQGHFGVVVSFHFWSKNEKNEFTTGRHLPILLVN